MKILVIIPARAGSKGIPKKNMQPVAGAPLLAWSIKHAVENFAREQIVVSTDDPEAARLALMFGVRVHDRPPELATDTALTDPVLAHVLREDFPAGPPPDHLTVLLQPTVPARRVGLARECVERLVQAGADSLLTGYPLHFVWRQQSRPLAPVRGTEWVSLTPLRVRRQDFPMGQALFHEDGSVYVTRSSLLLETGHRIVGRVEFFVTERTVDVDGPADLAVAETLLRLGR